MKFEELSEQSQENAREVLVYALEHEMNSRGYIEDNRAKYLAHNIRKSFIALETEEPEKCFSHDVKPFSGENDKNFGFANSSSKR